jgi:hypothetical protein
MNTPPAPTLPQSAPVTINMAPDPGPPETWAPERNPTPGSDLVSKVQIHADAFADCNARTIYKMGTLFNKAKRDLDHGEWYQYLDHPKVSWNPRNAQRLMRIASAPDGRELAAVGVRKATRLLESFDTPEARQSIMATHDVGNMTLTQLEKLLCPPEPGDPFIEDSGSAAADEEAETSTEEAPPPMAIIPTPITKEIESVPDYLNKGAVEQEPAATEPVSAPDGDYDEDCDEQALRDKQYDPEKIIWALTVFGLTFEHAYELANELWNEDLWEQVGINLALVSRSEAIPEEFAKGLPARYAANIKPAYELLLEQCDIQDRLECLLMDEEARIQRWRAEVEAQKKEARKQRRQQAKANKGAR